MSKQWKCPESHPHLMVSECGMVRFKDRESYGTDGGSKGYKQFRYTVDGVKFRPYVHRLVCEAFHGKPSDENMVVMHIDGTRANNNYKNLRWGTIAENTKQGYVDNPYQATRTPEGFKQAAILVWITGKFSSLSELSNALGIHTKTLSRWVRQK